MDDSPVSYSDVARAAASFGDRVTRTPTVTSRTVDAITDASVFFKCENFQRTGSFKFRGALNACLRLTPEQRSQGVLTYSSGNHAQALALAGKLMGISTTIVMPEDAPRVKLEATRGYGSEIVLYDRAETTREALARQIAEQSGKTIIPPYDHPDIIAGQGTAAKELIEDVGPLDVLLVCCGGGGLLAGSAVAARHLSPDCRVLGVEPEAADDGCRSFRTGIIQTVHNPDTIADGARTPYLGGLTFPIIRSLVSDMKTVTDLQLVRTMYFFWERLKIVVEPTGVLGAAALLEGEVSAPGKRIGVIVSGGNVDLMQAFGYFSSFLGR